MADTEEKPVTEEVAAAPEDEKGETTTKEAKPKGKSKAKAKGQGRGQKAQGKGKPDGPTWGGQGYRLNVKNFGNETNEELKALFEPFGSVVDAQVRMNEGKSRGFGFVIMGSEEDAKKAIAGLHDKEHGGKKLHVMPAERRAEEPGAAPTKGKGKGKFSPNDQAVAIQQQQQAQILYQQNLLLQTYIAHMQQTQYGGGYDPHGLWHAPASAASAPKTYEGSIKKINDKNKYAFISCKDTHMIYDRDVYLGEELFPEKMVQYSRVQFTVETNEQSGHPRATWCSLVL